MKPKRQQFSCSQIVSGVCSCVSSRRWLSVATMSPARPVSCSLQPGSAAADETAGETTAETQPVPATQAADPPSKDDPLLLLVSRAQPLAEDYAPELTQLHDWPYSIAAIAYEPLRQMLAAGRAEGLSFTVASAYRSTDSQRQLFDEDVEARVSEGMTEDEAREETARWTMPPGCSSSAPQRSRSSTSRTAAPRSAKRPRSGLRRCCFLFVVLLRVLCGV